MKFKQKIQDYNGTGKWQALAIQNRYNDYKSKFNIIYSKDLTPIRAENTATQWIYPVMDKVISGIEEGDLACTLIGIELIEESGKMPFGFTLKYKTARALRRSDLTPEMKLRLQYRIVAMLTNNELPKEYREYAKLLRKIGFDDFWPKIATISPNTLSAQRYFDYFKNVHEKSSSVFNHKQSKPFYRVVGRI